MFVIIYNNSVILGPMKWNKVRFQNVILEECEVETILPISNGNFEPITINEEIKILPVQYAETPPLNQKIEMLNGPYWEFTPTHAIASYIVQSLPIDMVKGNLKAKLADERWKKEIKGIKVTIQSIEITVDTNRGTRDIFVQQYLLMGESDIVTWKFPETWLNLTKSDLGLIVATGAAYVKGVFEWEADLVGQIDACTTLAELDAIVIVEETPNHPHIPIE